MKKSYEILNNHPVNIARRERGLNPANTIWIWGQGKKPNLSSFSAKYHLDGSVISAVDLIKGIGICAGLDSIDVPGVTATLNTNYEGKANAAIEEFKKGKQFVYMHLEGPDECGHQGELDDKLESMKRIDERIFAPIYDYLRSCGDDFRILSCLITGHRLLSEQLPLSQCLLCFTTAEAKSLLIRQSSLTKKRAKTVCILTMVLKWRIFSLLINKRRSR